MGSVCRRRAICMHIYPFSVRGVVRGLSIISSCISRLETRRREWREGAGGSPVARAGSVRNPGYRYGSVGAGSRSGWLGAAAGGARPVAPRASGLGRRIARVRASRVCAQRACAVTPVCVWGGGHLYYPFYNKVGAQRAGARVVLWPLLDLESGVLSAVWVEIG